MVLFLILSFVAASALGQEQVQQKNATGPTAAPASVLQTSTPTAVSLVAATPAAPPKPQFLAAAHAMGATKNVALTMAFNDDMMAYYYMWIAGVTVSSKVSAAGGFHMKSFLSSDLERLHESHASIGKKALTLFAKPFAAFVRRVEKQFKLQEKAEEATGDDEDEISFVEKGSEVGGKPLIPKSTMVIFIKWMDLCANYHITSNAYLMLAQDYKGLKSPFGYWKLGRTLAMLNWMWNLILNDYVTIMDQYKKVEWLEKHSKYTLRSMDLFVSMNWVANAMDIYTAVTSPMTTSKKALAYASAVNGCENMRSLKNIVMNGYIAEYAKPEVAKIFDINHFVLMDFAIKIVFSSAVTRASDLYAK